MITVTSTLLSHIFSALIRHKCITHHVHNPQENVINDVQALKLLTKYTSVSTAVRFAFLGTLSSCLVYDNVQIHCSSLLTTFLKHFKPSNVSLQIGSSFPINLNSSTIRSLDLSFRKPFILSNSIDLFTMNSFRNLAHVTLNIYDEDFNTHLISLFPTLISLKFDNFAIITDFLIFPKCFSNISSLSLVDFYRTTTQSQHVTIDVSNLISLCSLAIRNINFSTVKGFGYLPLLSSINFSNVLCFDEFAPSVNLKQFTTDMLTPNRLDCYSKFLPNYSLCTFSLRVSQCDCIDFLLPFFSSRVCSLNIDIDSLNSGNGLVLSTQDFPMLEQLSIQSLGFLHVPLSFNLKKSNKLSTLSLSRIRFSNLETDDLLFVQHLAIETQSISDVERLLVHCCFLQSLRLSLDLPNSSTTPYLNLSHLKLQRLKVFECSCVNLHCSILFPFLPSCCLLSLTRVTNVSLEQIAKLSTNLTSLHLDDCLVVDSVLKMTSNMDEVVIVSTVFPKKPLVLHFPLLNNFHFHSYSFALNTALHLSGRIAHIRMYGHFNVLRSALDNVLNIKSVDCEVRGKSCSEMSEWEDGMKNLHENFTCSIVETLL
ncbi:hypothetical protein RCL1_005098 [Eukaryota sp. TZLM3-RCL]